MTAPVIVYRIRFEIGINKPTNITAGKHDSTDNWNRRNRSILCECYMDSLRNIAYTEHTHNEKIIAIK